MSPCHRTTLKARARARTITTPLRMSTLSLSRRRRTCTMAEAAADNNTPHPYSNILSSSTTRLSRSYLRHPITTSIIPITPIMHITLKPTPIIIIIMLPP